MNERLEGTFVNGKLSGRGRRRFANGTVLEASFVDGIPQGRVTVREPDGSVYRGTMDHIGELFCVVILD